MRRISLDEQVVDKMTKKTNRELQKSVIGSY
jgi:hypothetical protein